VQQVALTNATKRLSVTNHGDTVRVFRAKVKSATSGKAGGLRVVARPKAARPFGRWFDAVRLSSTSVGSFGQPQMPTCSQLSLHPQCAQQQQHPYVPSQLNTRTSLKLPPS
jgi:hypothetical protein